ANSLIYWIYNLGIAVSPVVASVIVQRTGYLPLFCIDSLGTLLFCALLMIGLPETRPPLSIPTPHERNISASQAKGVWRDSSFLCFVVLSFVLTSVYAQNTSTLPADMQLHGLSAAQYGLAIAVNGLVVVLCGLPLSHLFSRCSPWRVLAISALLIGAGFGLTSLADHLVSLPFYAGSVALWTLGEILFIPTSATIVALLSPPSCRGAYQGIARTSWGLSACLGPLVGGFTLQLWPAYLWVSCAILGLFVAGGFLLIGRFKRLVRMSHI
ncbi:MAG TPA: MFS transporter, partial [Ktedonobacteraceae bacterium]|nr:MFS transporter [Ktedonobacteraceae bacterium]